MNNELKMKKAKEETENMENMENEWAAQVCCEDSDREMIHWKREGLLYKTWVINLDLAREEISRL